MVKECAGRSEGGMGYTICFLASCSMEHGGSEEYLRNKYDTIEDQDSLITH